MRTQIIDKTVVVSSVEGNVQILLADGSSRPLQPGEILQPGAKLNIADDAKLMLAPYDDNPGQAAATPAETDTPAEGQPSSSVENSNLPPEIAALQESILQGVDPTKNFEAAAAGGAPAAGGGGGIGGVAGASGNGGFVVIDRIGDATIAEAGFDTSHDALLDQNVLQEDDLLPENELDDLDESEVTQEDQAISGNLLINSSNSDGPQDTSIVSYSWGSNIGILAGVESSLDGIGTLIINADGSYTFTPALNYTGPVPPANYIVTNGDDTNNSTLTITITPTDETVSLGGLQVEGGELVLSDAALADGSSPNAAGLTKSGVFTFNAADGIQSLALGGVVLISNGQVISSFPQAIPSPLGNQLLVTGISYNPVTGAGTVTYSYTLSDNEAHTQPANDTALTESFNVALTDSDGDSTSASLDVVIQDDVPDAQNDTDSIAAGGFGPATGNLITDAAAGDAGDSDTGADTRGADGALVSSVTATTAAGAPTAVAGATVVQGAYGVLTLNPDGSYSYVRDAGTPGGVSEVFTYTLRDGDGDTDTATLTIAIGNTPPEISNLIPSVNGGDVVVDEDDLADGSDSSKESLTQAGSFTISSPDGVASLTIGGVTFINNGVFTAGSFVTGLGNTLSITGYNPLTGVVSYSYTLGDNETHANGAGENSLFENFAVVLTDQDGQSDSDTLSVNIVDDVPDAQNDTDSIAAGGFGPATGNLITDAAAGDAGDSDTGADTRGADGALVSSVTATTAAGAPTAVAGATVVQGAYGVLTLNPDGSYSYVRDAGTPGGVSEVFTYTLRDGDGDTDTATLTIAIGNTPPEISNLTPSVNGGDVVVDEDDLADGSDSSKESLTQTGSFTISSPDGVASLTIGGVTFINNGVFTADSFVTGLGNTLSITGYNPLTGVVSYSYTLGDNETHANGAGENSLFEDFAVVLTDQDGQSDSDTLSVNIVDDVPSVGSNFTVQLDDDALANGIPNGPNDDDNAVNTNGILAHNFGADGAGNVQWLTTGAPAGFTYETNPAGALLVKQGAVTVLTVTLNSATGEYSVTQNAPILHANADLENNQTFTLNYQVVDGDGDTATGTLAINVDDDTPLAKNDTAIVAESSGKDFNVAFVLDSSGSISNSEFNTMMNAVKAAGQALFNGTDGDVKITIVAFSSDSLAYVPVTSLAEFNALVDSIIANRPFNGDTDFTDAIQQTMVSYSPIEGWSNQVFFISDGNPNEQTGTGGNSLSNATATAWNTFVDSNGINVTAIGVGDGINTTRLQDVDLDGSGAPILVTDFNGLITTLLGQISGNFVSGNVLLGNNNAVGGGDDDSYGADGPGRIMSIKINGTTYSWDGVLDGDQQLTNITTALGGKLTFNFATGEWGYTSPQSVSADTSESFDYVIIDKDGDQANASLTINIEDAAPVIGKVDEDELPGGLTDNDAQTTVISGSLVELLVGTNSGQFGLDSTPNVMPSLTSDGVAVTYGFSGNTLTAMAGAVTVFTLVVQSNGSYTFTLLGPLDHPDANGDDNEILTLNLTGAIRASDGVNPLPLAGDLLIQVEDDIPSILASSNLVYSNSNNPGGAAGVFDYSTGADTRGTGPFSAIDSDFKTISLSGTVGGTTITSQSVTWVSESASTATFNFEFNYAPNPANPGTTQEATGTLIFDKVNGTYTVSLDDPVEGFSVLKTSASLNITGYASGGSVPDSTQPDVSVAKLDNDFYVQFRGASEPGGGTGTNNLQTGGANTNIFTNGELFTQASSWVSVSNSANGVAGDTIGKGEVLDLTFHTTNPTGTVVANPDGRAEGIFLKFDGINSEDLVVVLKLVGAGGITTTRALVISNSDIAKSSSSPATLAALLAYGITLDNNDGAIVIEHNDYNGAGENWQIYGAQILTSVEDITTSAALNFNAAFGDTGGSSQATTFSGQTDSDVVKVSDIGLITSENTTLDAELDFQVGVKDADNDATANTNLHVTIEAGTTFTGSASADVIQGSAGNDVLSGLAGDDSLIGGLGNDVLIGGLGSDILMGGDGKDTFKWQSGEAGGTDVIKDFTTGANGDVLDLSELLSGEHANATSLDQYLTFAPGPGVNKSTLTIDLDGSAGGTTTHTIFFDNVDLTANSTRTDQQIIQDLLDQGNLKVDP
ncbi:retention module-containing protein [Aeromonas media]|uniref:retention module-containing protein n=1 Tax=Aeromonas media TaxID=651 RepID=UPI001F21450E|nr:retention module-containing protein [Aeromonas media]